MNKKDELFQQISPLTKMGTARMSLAKILFSVTQESI